ncbi:unnamed protein product [Lactuca virosa]|uniref:Uncharacterized protein n=1 Tax=Lactuca virosa TaxID=75947 RepID=A0AAU9NBR1_9ASTR|nr:unnamed protein product [Lactuca virosa]
MRSCITDVASMLFDSIITRDSMITITIRKHLAEKLRSVFAMLHRLEDVSDQSFNPKQRGESVAGGSRKEGPKAPVKPIVKNEPKGKEKLFRDDPILDIEDEEAPTEEELKRRKVRESELDEHQRIIREAEDKDRAEKEAQATLQSKKLLFPKWTLKQIQRDAVDLPSQYWRLGKWMLRLLRS